LRAARTGRSGNRRATGRSSTDKSKERIAMSILSLKTAFAASLLAAAAVGVHAQTGTPPASAGGQPAAVGVTPQTAADANQRAVPRSDVGTVVRTAPSAADRTRDAAGNAGAAVGAATTGAPAQPMPAAAPRRARADRN
jgi:hypothetical protein